MNIAAASAVRPPPTSLVQRRAHRGRRSQAVRDRRLAQRRFLEEVDSTGEDFIHDIDSARVADFSRCTPKPSQPAEISGFSWTPSTQPSRPAETSGVSWSPADGGRGAVGTPFCAGTDRSLVAFPSCDVFPTEVSAAAPKGDGPDLSAYPPHGRGPGKSRDPTTPCELGADIKTHFRVFHLNVCDFDAHAHLLDAALALCDFPEFVAITETHLTKNVPCRLTKYELVSRRDRPDQRGWGGIALFARHDVHASIVFVRESATLELTWHTLHADVGPLLLGVWYRPPRRGEIEAIQQFDRELEGFEDHIGSIIVGDMNVHNEDWLTHSNGVSPEGRELEAVCAAHGLQQLVTEPTRGDYLLDLVLTDINQGLSCSVVPGVLDRDHRGVIVEANISIPSAEATSRECFDFGKARWSDIHKAFNNIDWAAFFEGKGPDEAASALSEKILGIAKHFVPVKVIEKRPYKHPWVDSLCKELLANKHAEIGKPGFAVARDACTAAFRQAHSRYLGETRDKLRKADSKDWWRLTKDLLGQAGGKENIPPLKRGKEWAKQPAEKASLLAETFTAKSRLPAEHVNEYTPISRSDAALSGFLRLRVRKVRKILKDLDEQSATGPDLIPTIILRRCAAQLDLPITLLARLCLNKGRWPLCWRTHWIHPLHKKKSRADPLNYRGVHLTPQLAKVVERAIGSLFVDWSSKYAFGEHQYAYSKNKSHRDVLAVNVCSWLLLFEQGKTIGLYCSDVSGAFDRVSRDRLCAKIEASGLPANLSAFLASWLEDRVSTVVVSGGCSPEETLANSVFQGTVLGPPLWNVFYADASFPVRSLGFVETVFADDFNCWKGFGKDGLPTMLKCEIEMRGAQRELHRWGQANRVAFDPSKESFIIMGRLGAMGGNFRLLGVTFDPKLLMHAGAREIAIEAGWRLKSILRARRFYTTPELVNLYKSLVLSYIESGTPGYYHASTSVLACIDRVQRRFLREINMTETDALLNYRLAPLRVRRDIAILGFLHRVNLRLVAPQVEELFPRIGSRSVRGSGIGSRVRAATAFHNRQLLDRVSATSTEQFKKSIFGMVQCYNALPQWIADKPTVSAFQRCLQTCIKQRAVAGTEWSEIFSIGKRYASVLKFQAFFRQ